MKLNINSLKNTNAWPGYRLPAFDIEKMTRATQANPPWLHLGAGNIFRALPAAMMQDLLEAGLTDRGIVVCECYDPEIIPACYAPHNNLSLLVTLRADGNVEKRVVASVADAFNDDTGKLEEIFRKPSLQMVTFTVTEKAYSAAGADTEKTIMGRVVSGLQARYNAGAEPLALVSLDNCSQNGDKLKQAVLHIAHTLLSQGKTEPGFINYLTSGRVAFPWTMIDKITPRPSEDVVERLKADGYEDARVLETNKHTFVSSFVNAEASQYLVIEDTFPNGRPPLEKAGAYLTNRETVQKVERMKVGACLNPLHTILAVTGRLLDYPTISAAVRDKRLAAFIRKAAYDESLPIVERPDIIQPEDFLREVLTERFPNPFIPDTPARIACDTSQKIPVRFGEMLKTRLEANLPLDTLVAVPMFFALWLRYLLGVNDQGEPMEISPDPRLPELTVHLQYIKLGYDAPVGEALRPILSDTSIFGVNLYDARIVLGGKTEKWFQASITGPGAVARLLDCFVKECAKTRPF